MSPHAIPKTSGIYRITCIDTGKFYIGSAVNLRNRWQQHYSSLKRKDHHSAALQNAWNKYGEQAFTFEVIEFVLIPFLLEREQHWIDTLKPFGNKGFNIALSAKAPRLGLPHSLETRAKMGLAQLGNTKALGNKNALGLKHTAETRAKMSANSTVKGKPAHNRGTKHRPETIEKMRIAQLGTKYGAETRAKMSASAIIAKASRRKTLIVADPNGIEYSVVGIRQFCKDHHLDRSTLMRVAKGEDRQHKGWKARFPD